MAGISRVFKSMVSIESIDRMSSVLDPAGQESFKQSVESVVRVDTDVEIEGLEIVKVWEDEDGFRALAVLERQKARDGWMRRMRELDSEIEGYLSGSADNGRFMRYRALRTASGLWIKREIIASRISVLGFKAGPVPFDIVEAFREMPVLKAAMPVFIEINGDRDGDLRERVAGALGGAGFVITVNRAEAAVLIEGTMNVQQLDIKHPSWKYARARANLKVTDADSGLALYEVVEDVRASHLTGLEAEKKAVKKATLMISGKIIKAIEE